MANTLFIIDDDVLTNLPQSVRDKALGQQMSNILQSIRQHGINVTSRGVPTRFPSTPERGGVGFQLKEIITVGAAKLAMTVTGGVAALESVKAEVVEAFADGRDPREILQHQRDAINGTPRKKPQGLGYYATHQALIDTRELFSYELLGTDLARWPKD